MGRVASRLTLLGVHHQEYDGEYSHSVSGALCLAPYHYIFIEDTNLSLT